MPKEIVPFVAASQRPYNRHNGTLRYCGECGHGYSSDRELAVHDCHSNKLYNLLMAEEAAEQLTRFEMRKETIDAP